MERWKDNTVVINPFTETRTLDHDAPEEEFLETTARMMVTYSMDSARFVNKVLKNLSENSLCG